MKRKFYEPLVIQSKGSSGAVISYKENLLIPDNVVFPTIEIASKLVKSEHINDFFVENHNKLIKELGYYSDLQSVKSEDAVTWSLFGYLAYQSREKLDLFYIELLNSLNLVTDKNCNIKLWTRLTHPDNFGSGGPEMDVIILGDKYLFLIECKWSSGIGKNQGIDKNMDQIQIRNKWKHIIGNRLFPNHQIKVVIVANKNFTSQADYFINWDTFCDFNSLPHKEEFTSYLNWRKKYI